MIPPEDVLTTFEIFDELEVEEDFNLEDLEKDVLDKQRKYRADLYLDPLDLATKRMDSLQVSCAEKDAIERAALAVVEYASTGSVKKSAMDIIEEVAPDTKRCVRLLNCVIPLSRSFSSSVKQKEIQR